jgi:hypothetical protein
VGVVDDDFAFVAASARRAARLQQEACQAIVDDPTARRGSALANHLKLAYDAIENRVTHREYQFNAALDDSVKEDAIIEMRRLVWEVRDLQSNLAWLDAAQAPPCGCTLANSCWARRSSICAFRLISAATS